MMMLMMMMMAMSSKYDDVAAGYDGVNVAYVGDGSGDDDSWLHQGPQSAQVSHEGAQANLAKTIFCNSH